MYHAQAPGARLQQQPPRFSNRQQQQGGSSEFQPRRPQPFDVPASQMGGGERQYQGKPGQAGSKS